MIVVIMTFIGQSIAAVNLCCDAMPSHSDHDMPMLSMDGTDHANHTMHAVDSEQATQDCCTDDTCMMSSCIASPFLSTSFQLKIDSRYGQALGADLTASYLNPAPLSLFRPPISR